MPRPREQTRNEDEIRDHFGRTLDVMSAINRETALLLKQADAISDRLSRLDPTHKIGLSEETTEMNEANARHAADARLSPRGAAQAGRPPESGTTDDALVDRIANSALQKIMTQIQPLLDALEKVRDERAQPRQMTEAEFMGQLLEGLRGRIARRRGFVPHFYHEENGL